MKKTTIQHYTQQAFGAFDTDLEGYLYCPRCQGVVMFVDAWVTYDPTFTIVGFVDCWKCENCSVTFHVHEE